MLKALVVIFILSLSKVSYSDESMRETHSIGELSWSYDVSLVRGWKVLVHDNVGARVKSKIIKQLEYSLSLVDTKIPLHHLKFLRTIPIYVSNEENYPLRANEYGSIVFHHSRKWLSDHMLNPNMAVSVHVINPKDVLENHQIFKKTPYVILHELSHGFHYYKLGPKYSPILNAFESAKINHLYLKVPSRNGDGNFVRAYAITNNSEYFAELTEAYFGVNDYFPKTRSELFLYDPIGYKAIQKAWE